MYCTNCGKELDDECVYCVHCGAKVQVQEEITTSGKSFLCVVKKLIPITVLVCCVVIGVVFLVGHFKEAGTARSEEDDSYVTVTTEEQQTSEWLESTIETTSELIQDDSTEADSTQTVKKSKKEKYAEIVKSLSKKTPVNLEQEELETMVLLAEAFVETRLGESNSQYLMDDFSDTELGIILASLLDEFEWSPTGTTLYLDYVERLKDKEDRVIYEKAVLNRLLADYMKLESKDSDCWQASAIFSEKNDKYVYYPMGEGEVPNYFTTMMVTENKKYRMITAPCFFGLGTDFENEYVYTIRLLFKKSSKGSFGYRLVFVDTTLPKPQISKIATSSTLEDGTGNSYAASNMLDHDVNTAWAEGAEDVGVGETITIKLDKKQTVFGVLILNGYYKSDQIHRENGALSEILVDFGDGEAELLHLTPKSLHEGYIDECKNYYYMSMANYLEFSKPVKTDKIIITILDAELGTVFDDTCISEIDVY